MGAWVAAWIAELWMVAASPILPDLRLEYVRGDNAQDCPDASVLEEAVATRVGYPPFRAEAESSVLVSVDREDGKLQAVLQVTNVRGAVSGERTLVSRKNDCGELIRLLALDISIVLQMAAMEDPPPEELSSGTAAPPPRMLRFRTVPPSPPAPVARPWPWWRPSYAAEVGWFAALGVGPGVANGASAAVELGLPSWRAALGLGLRGVMALPLALSGGSRLWLRGVDVGPRACFMPGWLRACVSTRGGVFVAQPEAVTSGRTSVLPWATVGGLLGVEVPLWRFVRVGLGLEAGAHVVRPRFVDSSGAAVWTMPPGELGLVAQLAGRWP